MYYSSCWYCCDRLVETHLSSPASLKRRKALPGVQSLLSGPACCPASPTPCVRFLRLGEGAETEPPSAVSFPWSHLCHCGLCFQIHSIDFFSYTTCWGAECCLCWICGYVLIFQGAAKTRHNRLQWPRSLGKVFCVLRGTPCHTSWILGHNRWEN